MQPICSARTWLDMLDLFIRWEYPPLLWGSPDQRGTSWESVFFEDRFYCIGGNADITVQRVSFHQSDRFYCKVYHIIEKCLPCMQVLLCRERVIRVANHIRLPLSNRFTAGECELNTGEVVLSGCPLKTGFIVQRCHLCALNTGYTV